MGALCFFDWKLAVGAAWMHFDCMHKVLLLSSSRFRSLHPLLHRLASLDAVSTGFGWSHRDMQRKPPILGKVELIRTQSWSLRYNADNTGQICEQPEDLQLAQELPSGRVKLVNVLSRFNVERPISFSI